MSSSAGEKTLGSGRGSGREHLEELFLFIHPNQPVTDERRRDTKSESLTGFPPPGLCRTNGR